MFDSLDVSVRHVFGADVGRQEIYITVPRRHRAAIRKFVGRARRVGDRPLAGRLRDAPRTPPAFRTCRRAWLGRGSPARAAGSWWIDTGADSSHEDFGGRLDVIDMVDEGPEDWVGHGTHVAGISISGNSDFFGMAKEAAGIMAKVFSETGRGVGRRDHGLGGHLPAEGVGPHQLSLGSRGNSADNLAEFFSQLTHQKNANGEYPIVSASAGNSGPFDNTLSQPAAGADVLAVAAAAKSLDDGKPEIAFYSSVGPDIDRRYAVKRWRLKPEIAGIGGDVVTLLKSASVYLFGVFSARSKDAQPSSADTRTAVTPDVGHVDV